MKKTILSILTITFFWGFGFVSLAHGQGDQAVTAGAWKSGSYKVWKVSPSGVVYPQSKKADLQVTKDGAGKASKVILNGKTYLKDKEGISELARFYQCETQDLALYFTKKGIYQFSFIPGNGGRPDACTRIYYSFGKKYIYTDQDKLSAHIDATKDLQAADIQKHNAKLAAEKGAKLQARKDQYSIEGKDVSVLAIVNASIPEKWGHYREFSFDVEATLKNGKVLSTADNGFASDYKISFSHSGIKESSSKLYGNRLEGGFVKGDKILIEVVSKYDPSIKVTQTLVPHYNEDINFNYNAHGWDHRGVGYSGHDFKIEIKQVKHGVEPGDILMMRITDLTKGEVMADFKIGVDQTLNFSCNGYPGFKYDNGGLHGDGSNGGNGGDGGNITVVTDPSVKRFNINHSNSGGRAGAGINRNYDGIAGRAGDYDVQVRPVSF